jgi:formate dehydrogenase subunit gamma
VAREEVVLSDRERRLLAGVADLSRFDRIERMVHWVNATLFAVLMATASVLYVPFISAAVGRREAVKTIHVYAGLLLPLPLLLGIAGRWGRRLRADLGRLNRWSGDDRAWFVARGWRRGRVVKGVRLGKFNPGQKLNAAFTGGAIVLMLATGSIMRWYKPWPLSWRTGATFVHDWIAIALFVTITGHVLYALRDPDSLSSMWRGTISRTWARRWAPRWVEELDRARGEPRPGESEQSIVESGPL